MSPFRYQKSNFKIMSIRLAFFINELVYLTGIQDAIRSRVLDAEIVGAVITDQKDLIESPITKGIPIYGEIDSLSQEEMYKDQVEWLEAYNPEWVVVAGWQESLDNLLNRYEYRVIHVDIKPALKQSPSINEPDPIAAGLAACQQGLAQEMHLIAYLLSKPNERGIVLESNSTLIYKRDSMETLSMRIQQAVAKTVVAALHRLTEGDD